MTTPAPSWPRMEGKSPSGSAPERVKSSVWQRPVALISMRTSPALGSSRSTSTISSGLPAAKATAARVFMGSLQGLDSLYRKWHTRTQVQPAFARGRSDVHLGYGWPLADELSLNRQKLVLTITAQQHRVNRLAEALQRR